MNKNFCRIKYDKKTDSFCLMLSNDGGEEWNLCIACPCHRAEGESKDIEPMYVSIDLIEELKKAVACGFEFVY